MKHTKKLKMAVWAACVGIFTMMLTSCMELMLVGMAAGVDYLAERSSSSTSYSAASSTSSYSAQPIAASYQKAPANIYATSEGRLVDSQISWVWQQCKVRDFDGNGKVNCCDRATAFCIQWRRCYTNSVRLCQQMTRSLDHMYVQIWLDGYGWWSVDPAYTANGTHDMKEVWGRRYDRAYDEINAYWITEFNRYIY